MTERARQKLRLCQKQSGLDESQKLSPLEVVKAYHQRTKHSTEGYALGPASLDWEAQPSPYRHFHECETFPLSFTAPNNKFSALFDNSIEPVKIDQASISQLFEYALSMAAIKIFGPDQWSVRCNPSSGNLHPTEAYLINGGIEGLAPGLYHYNSQKHQLEQRNQYSDTTSSGQIHIALTSVHWREAWKYGERAYRYCQLDVGHAMAAIRYSAALLGWQCRIVTEINDSTLQQLTGIDREDDFAGVEHESPDLLLQIGPASSFKENALEQITEASTSAQWFGYANLLDPRPLYHWQLIDQVSKACEKDQAIDSQREDIDTRSSHHDKSEISAGQLIKQRRSALAFQSDKTMSLQAFKKILTALLVEESSLPLDLLAHAPRLHPVIFVHRVEGLAPGLYCLPRSIDAKNQLQQAMDKRFDWQQLDPSLPLYLLEQGDGQAISKRISCHQAIASESAFTLGMLAEFDQTLCSDSDAWRYRELYWEAGMLGQILYLEAEHYGYRGTGIGCFLDDLFHQLLGIEDQQFQSLYHFTVGTPVVDERITTLSPY